MTDQQPLTSNGTDTSSTIKISKKTIWTIVGVICSIIILLFRFGLFDSMMPRGFTFQNKSSYHLDIEPNGQDWQSFILLPGEKREIKIKTSGAEVHFLYSINEEMTSPEAADKADQIINSLQRDPQIEDIVTAEQVTGKVVFKDK